MAIEWKLRQVMAKNNIWTGTELARVMYEKTGYKLSPPSISVLINECPKQMKVTTLDALCTTLDCSPVELLVHKPSLIQEKVSKGLNEVSKKMAVNSSTEINRKLPPI